MKRLPVLLLLAALSLAQADDEPPAKTHSLKEKVDALSEEDLKDFLSVLKAHYIKPDTLTESELMRATVQGVLDRMGRGASLESAKTPGEGDARPFRAEVLESTISYIRLGSLVPDHLEKLDAALADHAAKKLGPLVLDLRDTPPGVELERAAEVCQRFCPKGRVLFTLRKPSAGEEQLLTSKEAPKFAGLLVVLVSDETAGAAEVIAAVLRSQARAMIIGQKTRGQAVEFAEVPLPSGTLLRVAVAEAALPDAAPVFPGGLTPDLLVDVPPAATTAALKHSLEAGVATVLTETERPRMNESALVAGRNPDLDALQAAQARKGERPPVVPRDVTLQRAVDFIVTVSLYEHKPARPGK